MSEVEKLILEKLDVLSQDVHEVKEVALEAREEATKAKEMAMEAKEVAMGAKEEAAKAREAAMEAKETTLKTQVTLENEISRKIDIIGEGHDFLNMRLDEALRFKMKSERMELDMLSLRMDVNKIKNHLNIA